MLSFFRGTDLLRRGNVNSHHDGSTIARLKITLDDLKYLYDFSDGWGHVVKAERIANAMPGLPYPVLLDPTDRWPSEGVGGPWSCNDLLQALVDPRHEMLG